MTDNMFTLSDKTSEMARRYATLLGHEPDHIVNDAMHTYASLLDATWEGKDVVLEDPRTGNRSVVALRDGAPVVRSRPKFLKWALDDRLEFGFLLMTQIWLSIVALATLEYYTFIGAMPEGAVLIITALSRVSLILGFVFLAVFLLCRRFVFDRPVSKGEGAPSP
mgnify:FL=1